LTSSKSGLHWRIFFRGSILGGPPLYACIFYVFVGKEVKQSSRTTRESHLERDRRICVIARERVVGMGRRMGIAAICHRSARM
jgi:hypothetical protein